MKKLILCIMFLQSNESCAFNTVLLSRTLYYALPYCTPQNICNAISFITMLGCFIYQARTNVATKNEFTKLTTQIDTLNKEGSQYSRNLVKNKEYWENLFNTLIIQYDTTVLAPKYVAQNDFKGFTETLTNARNSLKKHQAIFLQQNNKPATYSDDEI